MHELRASGVHRIVGRDTLSDLGLLYCILLCSLDIDSMIIQSVLLFAFLIRVTVLFVKLRDHVGANLPAFLYVLRICSGLETDSFGYRKRVPLSNVVFLDYVVLV
jgi:hypothetical protein